MVEQSMLRGLYVAITTPFRNGLFDEEAFGQHVEHLIANGLDGLVPCGTTGEAATMTREEKKRVIGAAVKAADGRVPVVAGVGTNSTQTTLMFAEDALEVGADGLLIVTPYYNKPTQEGLYQHFAAVAKQTDAPIVVYNVPGRTSVSINPETIAALAKLPQIVAVKDATADLRGGARILSQCGDNLAVLSGDDFSALGLLSMGGQGVISVVGNVDPRRTGRMIHAALDGDYQTAQRVNLELLALTEALFETTNPIPVKKAVSLLGFGTDAVRLPLVPMDSDAAEGLTWCMRSLELI
jgi:4-hydroxy-tetrahydrodipicolinate synthase